ncbi:ABC transporter ATP-binding protein [Desulfovibrio litoralis]|uniref:Heme exporter protein A n=1 Tax=Desulfovibrio litoralis DSM 11393 TaxID=1121455 RepID=A0A1M7RSP3_9BACT|nr:ABC transporter ATP-binding protein [Desulfovibrio litoralis]SHN49221.1 heme exporter protein A [Desulfovibrio litoralis DSM 11393]
MSELLKTTQLAKFYGQRLIFKEVNFIIKTGTITLLIGNNGSGKSTLMKILAGLTPASIGKVENKVSPLKLAYLGHQTFIYPQLTALENLMFWAKLYNQYQDEPSSKKELTKQIESVLDKVSLRAFAEEKAGTFSRGMAQRLNLARVFLQKPKLILLDEPSTGLDLNSINMLQQAVLEAKQNNTAIVWISHNINEDIKIADSVIMLGKAKMLYSGNAENFDCNLMTEQG